jgi:hypothetical protein
MRNLADYWRMILKGNGGGDARQRGPETLDPLQYWNGKNEENWRIKETTMRDGKRQLQGWEGCCIRLRSDQRMVVDGEGVLSNGK